MDLSFHEACNVAYLPQVAEMNTPRLIDVAGECSL